MWERLSHWQTTVGGTAISVGMIVSNSLGCQVPNDWKTWSIMIAPALIGALMKGKKN